MPRLCSVVASLSAELAAEQRKNHQSSELRSLWFGMPEVQPVLPPVAVRCCAAHCSSCDFSCSLCLALKLIRSLPCLCQAVPPVGASRACSSCVRTADVKDACAQCDRLVCQSCSRLCSCCNTVTCSLCCAVE